MRGKKGDKGKKGYGKGKYGKSFGKYDKSNEYSKNNEYGKGNVKGKEKGKEGKGKGQVKDEKPAPNSSFQCYCRSCGKWEHKASECWQGYAQAVEGKLRVLLQVQWRRVQGPHLRLRREQRLFKRSMMSMNQDGSSA